MLSITAQALKITNTFISLSFQCKHFVASTERDAHRWRFLGNSQKIVFVLHMKTSDNM